MNKIKTYKLTRDSKKTIIQQIEWLKIYLNEDCSCDFIKRIYSLDKKVLIEIWTDLVIFAEYPQLDWLMIYY